MTSAAKEALCITIKRSSQSGLLLLCWYNPRAVFSALVF